MNYMYYSFLATKQAERVEWGDNNVTLHKTQMSGEIQLNSIKFYLKNIRTRNDICLHIFFYRFSLILHDTTTLNVT
jgi:hypothetical protein